ncbi:hypothetical protein ACV341_35790, partial [Pseudomonas aeruginosa]
QVMDAWLLDEHGKLKAEYAEPVAPLAAAGCAWTGTRPPSSASAAS